MAYGNLQYQLYVPNNRLIWVYIYSQIAHGHLNYASLQLPYVTIYTHWFTWFDFYNHTYMMGKIMTVTQIYHYSYKYSLPGKNNKKRHTQIFLNRLKLSTYLWNFQPIRHLIDSISLVYFSGYISAITKIFGHLLKAKHS